MLSLDVRQVLLILLSSLLLSCDWGVEWRDKPYEVVWINIGENRMLNYEIAEGSSIGRVEAEIIAVGSNEKYVVAKQRSIDDESILIIISIGERTINTLTRMKSRRAHF